MTNAAPRTVLITTPSLDPGTNVSGVSTVVRGIVSHCTNSRWQFRTIIIGKTDRLNRGLLWALKQTMVPVRFLIELACRRPSIVHINGPLLHFAIARDLVLLGLAKLFPCRLVYHLHGGNYVSQRPTSGLLCWMISTLLTIPDAIIVLGRREAEDIVNLYGIDPARVTILPNAVSISPISYSRERLGPLRVLSLGRLSPEKGLDVLCDAVEGDAELCENIHLRMYGAGPLEAVLIPRLAAALGPRFEFGGVIGPSERDVELQWADILIMPSLRGEGLPMALLEAMAAGVVPIATDDGMISDVLQPYVTGFLIAKGSADSITQSMRKARSCREEGELETMSRTARKLIAQNHSLEAYSHALEKVYADLCRAD